MNQRKRKNNAEGSMLEPDQHVEALRSQLKEVNARIIDIKKEQATLGFLPEQPEILADLMHRRIDLQARLSALDGAR